MLLLLKVIALVCFNKSKESTTVQCSTIAYFYVYAESSGNLLVVSSQSNSENVLLLLIINGSVSYNSKMYFVRAWISL